MELVNSSYTIMNRSGAGMSGPLSSLGGGTSGTFISDPQVIWDASSNRFYFSLFENRGTSTPNEGIAWGFSKTATPNSASDFCSYFNNFNYGATSFPDRQSLGDTQNFLLVGSNRYSTSSQALMGSDVAWITKPPAGNTCPAASSFGSGIQSLKNPDGTAPYTPTPSREVDGSTTGWIVATPSYVSGNSLTLFSVTKNSSTGQAVISAPASVTVPAYSYPPSAPQAGKTVSGSPAPPLETRIYLTQVIAAYDPRLGHIDLWTAHTIAGGAGSEVRWYEINPLANVLDQTGTVSSPTLYVFNGTISPDRLVNGSNSAYGNNALINVNTSSLTTYPAIQMVSSLNGQPESGLVMVKQSTGANIDYTCFEPGATSCRWGDYSGATPDPGASTKGLTGGVWSANQWNIPDINDSTPVWRTTIFNVALSAITNTTPPTQPTNLTATAVSSSQINLSWTASTDNVGVAGYTIYRNGTKLTTVTTNSYDNTGLTASTTYSYYVVAYDAAGNNSQASTTVSATTTKAATATTGTVQGTVTDAKTGKPIAGAYVQTGPGGTADGAATSYTNSAGQYVLTNLILSYEHYYTFSASGYASQTIWFNISSGTTTHNVSLTPN
jgi:chitodextrinase